MNALVPLGKINCQKCLALSIRFYFKSWGECGGAEKKRDGD